MSLVHHVRGRRSCPGGLGLGSLAFNLEDVAWGDQRFSDIVYASGQEALGSNWGLRRIGRVFNCIHGDSGRQITGAFTTT